MVDEIGPENVVHIVTDNGSNYKKACKALGEVYEHIVTSRKITQNKSCAKIVFRRWARNPSKTLNPNPEIISPSRTPVVPSASVRDARVADQP